MNNLVKNVQENDSRLNNLMKNMQENDSRLSNLLKNSSSEEHFGSRNHPFIILKKEPRQVPICRSSFVFLLLKCIYFILPF
jgi:hypothetical protein